MSPEDVKKLIEDGVEGAEAIITGEGCNLEATVIRDAFEGKNMLARAENGGCHGESPGSNR